MSDDNGEKVIGQSSEKAATQTPSTRAGFFSRVFWLGDRVAEAREKTFKPSQPGYLWYDIGRQICDDVVKIGETGKGSWAVLLMDSIAAELFVRAHLERAGLAPSAGHLGPADWDNARKLPGVEAAWGKLANAHADRLIAMVGPERNATIAKLSPEDREGFAVGVHDFVMRVAEPLEVEANRLGRALFSRWARIGVGLAVLAVLLGLAGNWVAAKLAKPNIALHKPVTVSSQFPGQGMDHSQLVDGDHDNMGFHTQNGGTQWAVIDLGQPRKISRIVVYNRADGFEERAVPLTIEVSNDNVNYTQIAQRKETFDKWAAKNLNAEGRYVRLKNTTPNYFHLAEVEVY